MNKIIKWIGIIALLLMTVFITYKIGQRFPMGEIVLNREDLEYHCYKSQPYYDMPQDEQFCQDLIKRVEKEFKVH